MAERLEQRVMGVPWDGPLPFETELVRGKSRGFGAWCSFIGMRAAQVVAGVLPGFLQRPLLSAVAFLAHHCMRRYSSAARAFIATAYPDLAPDVLERRVRQAWRHLLLLGVQTGGLARLFRGKRIEEHFDLELSDAARAVIESGAGCILITAHVGNWEAAGAPIQALGLRPFYAVFKAPKNDPLARWMQRTREAQGAHMLPRKGAMKGIPGVVRAGGSVLMLLDQRARKKPVIAPFFGRPAACDRSAGVLLRRLGAPLVFLGCYATEDPRRFRLRLGTVLSPDDLAGLGPEGVAARLNRELESLILERPDQYFWLHDRYKGVPAAPVPSTP